jgi:1-acyl-sn-glycerol-3-phosphate acyltransferase
LSYLDAATGKPTLAPAYIDDISLVQCLNAILKSPPIKARLVIGPQLHALRPDEGSWRSRRGRW